MYPPQKYHPSNEREYVHHETLSPKRNIKVDNEHQNLSRTAVLLVVQHFNLEQKQTKKVLKEDN